MVFLVKVQVNIAALQLFAAALQRGVLDNSHVRGETWCLKDEPAVGYSVWETTDKNDFERRFNPWREYYSKVEINEVVSPKEAMAALFGQLGSK
jgi:hypothetical protein